ncbi:heterokaryon incompatibility protein [Colletotrichum sojae]|uniref:Heterokaryon incompatibility protein n=1 Tax=Colletotrichum sojae TaxID=2175907 RepID=A0A8H6IYK5_9PEZI|nr:heterokaryon incompatibility protein [Colletotrichum sojae]
MFSTRRVSPQSPRRLIRRPKRKRWSAAKTHLNPSHSPTQDKKSAVYAPLPDPNSYIRLLRIQSVEATLPEAAQIRCVLEIVAIDQAPPYNAISYTWGPLTPTQSIFVDGQLCDVRENCKAVLLQAHSWGPGEYYWIDAICIDQSNLEEKGSQVALMGDLFGKAKHVLACVGEHADDSEFLYAALGEARGSLALEFVLWAVQNDAETVRKLYHALRAFRGRPYFTRVWVYQELFLARDVILFCGESYLPVNLFHGFSISATCFPMSESQDRSNANWKDGVPIQPDYTRDSTSSFILIHRLGWRKRSGSEWPPEAATWAAQMEDEATIRAAERGTSSKRHRFVCSGSCVMQNDGEGLHILLRSSRSSGKEDPSSCTRTYNVRRGLENAPSKLKRSIIVTPNVRAGDWIISACESPCLKLVVRKQVDGPFFWIVGYAFVPVKVKLMNIFNDAEEFTLFLDTEDALLAKTDLSRLQHSLLTAACSSDVLSTASLFSTARRSRYARHSPMVPQVEHLNTSGPAKPSFFSCSSEKLTWSDMPCSWPNAIGTVGLPSLVRCWCSRSAANRLSLLWLANNRSTEGNGLEPPKSPMWRLTAPWEMELYASSVSCLVSWMRDLLSERMYAPRTSFRPSVKPSLEASARWSRMLLPVLLR